MRAFVVVPDPEGLEAALLRAQRARRRSRRLALEFSMHPLVLAVLLGTRRRDPLVHDPELHPPDIEDDKPRMPVDANGAPLSVRIASGRPTSRNSARNTGWASVVFTERSPRHTSKARLK
jgi:hypothetical protein